MQKKTLVLLAVLIIGMTLPTAVTVGTVDHAVNWNEDSNDTVAVATAWMTPLVSCHRRKRKPTSDVAKQARDIARAMQRASGWLKRRWEKMDAKGIVEEVDGWWLISNPAIGLRVDINMSECLNRINNNVHSEHAYQLPPVIFRRLSPSGLRLRHEGKSACIQVEQYNGECGIDSLCSLIDFVKSDGPITLMSWKALGEKLRRPLLDIFGFHLSPISNVLAEFVEEFGGVYDEKLGTVTVTGTPSSTKWRLSLNAEGFFQVEVLLPGRVGWCVEHVFSYRGPLDYLKELSAAPRRMASHPDEYECEFVGLIARRHLPLRNSLKVHGNEWVLEDDFDEDCDSY